MPDVTVLGSANMDFTVAVERLPAPGETLLGGELYVAHGGKGANQALAASRAGVAVAFIAKVGRDAHGGEIRRHLLASGLSLDAILEAHEAPTGVALILVERGGRNQIVVAPGSNMRLFPADLAPYTFLLQGSRVLLAQLETPVETVAYALEQARRARVVTILNPAPARVLAPAIYPLLDLITPNETEATVLTGIEVKDVDSARDAVRWFLDEGCLGAMVTLGAAGVVVANEAGTWHFPAFAVDAVDTTSAGDAFNGVLAAMFAKGRPTEEALRWACAAGALACTCRGAQESLPGLAALESFLAARPAPAPCRLR